MKDFEREYRELGPYHHNLRGFSKWWILDNYRILASWTGRAGPTLDLACGDGMIWPFLESSGLIGVDHAPTGLKQSRSFAGIPLVQADMRALPFKAATIRNVVCSLSLQYLEELDLEKCLFELSRVMTADGRLALSYPNVRAGANGSGSHAAVPYRRLLAELKKTGFRPMEVRGISLRMPAKLVRWSLSPLGRPLAGLYYRISKIARFFPERSYHYALRCLKAGEGIGA